MAKIIKCVDCKKEIAKIPSAQGFIDSHRKEFPKHQRYEESEESE